MTTLFVPKESRAGERRVAASPESVKKLVQAGLDVRVERGAGDEAGFTAGAFEAAGARLVDSPDGYATADLIFKVAPPTADEGERIKSGVCLFSLLDPYRNLDLVRRLATRGVISFAMELVPRTTRAQSMDVLSSQASIAGYKAVVLAASRLGKYFPQLMTAAGTIPPARIVVLGAGVAGLQALATARRLGAVVEVSDVRAAVKEQVESLGGRFIDLPQMPTAEGAGGYAKEVSKEFLDQQRAVLTARLAAADVVITTAQVPGKKAPILVTKEMVEAMRPGAVLVDIAAGQGGNCELTSPDREMTFGGVKILGPSNLPASMPADASLLYARNLWNFFQLVWKEKSFTIPEDDDVVAGTLLTRGGKVVHPGIAALVSG